MRRGWPGLVVVVLVLVVLVLVVLVLVVLVSVGLVMVGQASPMPESLTLDHVVLAVPDLERASSALRERTGLQAVPGGRHASLGTANALVPLAGRAYLELVAVVDPAAAASNPWGRAIAAAAVGGADSPMPLLWCVRSADLEATVTRLRLSAPTAWSRRRPDGVELRWRLAGLPESLARPNQPFVIGWDVPADLHPAAGAPAGAAPAAEAGDVRRAQLELIELAGDRSDLDEWLGGLSSTRVEVDRGQPAVRAVHIRTSTGLIRLP